MLLSNGVTIEGSEGQTITAPGATWNSFTSMLRSRGRVAYRSAIGKVTADMLVVDVRNREMQMWNVALSADVGAIEALARKEERHAN